MLRKHKHWSYACQTEACSAVSANAESKWLWNKVWKEEIPADPGINTSCFTCISIISVHLLFIVIIFLFLFFQLSKTNGHYHKLFKEISKDELLKQSKWNVTLEKQRNVRCYISNLLLVPTGYTCAVQKDILYQGKMFVSDNWICFHSKVFGKDTKVSCCNCNKGIINAWRQLENMKWRYNKVYFVLFRFQSQCCLWLLLKKLKLHY